MKYPVALPEVQADGYQTLAGLGKSIVVQMTNAVADFPAPNPSLATIDSESDALFAARNTWYNNPTQTNFENLEAAAKLLYDHLFAEAEYVQSVVVVAEPSDYPAAAALIRSAGFACNYPN